MPDLKSILSRTARRLDAIAVWMAARHILTANAVLLALCASMYLGTGGSLVLFQFPSFDHITVENYPLIINGPVLRATRFFTWMTQLMYLSCAVILIAEFRTRMRWFPLAVIAEITAVTLLTVLGIFRYNQELYDGITDPARLREVLDAWMALNWVRVSIWVIMWLTIMGYIAIKAAPVIKARK